MIAYTYMCCRYICPNNYHVCYTSWLSNEKTYSIPNTKGPNMYWASPPSAHNGSCTQKPARRQMGSHTEAYSHLNRLLNNTKYTCRQDKAIKYEYHQTMFKGWIKLYGINKRNLEQRDRQTLTKDISGWDCFGHMCRVIDELKIYWGKSLAFLTCNEYLRGSSSSFVRHNKALNITSNKKYN